MAAEPLWVIGDLQGCLGSLESLLRQLPGDCRLLFIGDLINRGPRSLDTLRRVAEQYLAPEMGSVGVITGKPQEALVKGLGLATEIL